MSRAKSKSRVAEGDLSELALKIARVRDECHQAADLLSRRKVLGVTELEHCVRLSDSLAATQHYLKATVAQIAIYRRRRQSESPRVGGA